MIYLDPTPELVYNAQNPKLSPVVGGPIEIAAITKHEKFKWIERKHYYDYSLNQEPIHVVVD